MIKPVVKVRLAREEQDAVIERSSFCGGMYCARWSDADEQIPVETPPSQLPPLSASQLGMDVVWRSAHQAFPSHKMVSGTSAQSIMQKNVADCSLVAALIIGAEHHARFGSKLAMSCLYPQIASGLPMMSPSGKYNVKLMINAVDDQLPCGTDGSFQCATSEGQLWASLVEKAYMTLMGGYDFAGSNSGVDLHALSGWAPEHLPLKSSGHQTEKIWTRIYEGFKSGHCVLTAGTSKVTDYGLAPLHNYAVTDLREQNGVREVELLDPWNRSDSFASDLQAALPRAERFVVPWEAISAYFESLYINWDPQVSNNTFAVHSTFTKLPSVGSDSCHSSQLRLHLEAKPPLPIELCVLLTRHQKLGLERDEFIGLSVVRGFPASTRSSPRADLKSTMTDSPHVFYRFRSEPGVSDYDIFVSHQGPSQDINFTLKAWGEVPLRIEDGPPPFPYSATIRGKWADKSAGGNHTYPSFMNNPQFRVALSTIPGRANPNGLVTVVCETSKDTSVNLRLIRRKGERVTDFEDLDVVAGTAKYSYGVDSCHVDDLRADIYTLVVSSFTPNEEADFYLNLRSTLPIEVTPVPQEGAGMYSRFIRGSWEFGADGGSSDLLFNPRYLIGNIKQSTNVRLRLQVVSPSAVGNVPIGLAIFSVAESEEGEPLSPGKVLESTGSYSDVPCGVATKLVRLAPSEKGYLVIPSTFTAATHAKFQLFLHGDKPLALSALPPP